MTITQILEKVAQLAEGLEEALQDVQIGDYVISMNASPLEIQVKQAIANIPLPEESPTVQKVISKGEGDGEHTDVMVTDVVMQPQTGEADLITADDHNNWTLNQPRDIHNEVTGTLKRKKNIGIAERLRRALRFSFRRRRN